MTKEERAQYNALNEGLQHRVNRVFVELPFAARLTLAKQIAYDEMMCGIDGWDDRYAMTDKGIVFSLHTLKPIYVKNGKVRFERNGERSTYDIADLFLKTFKRPFNG